MPFTFAHPAAILPFTRFPKKYVSVIGLIVGSMAPDMEYFIRFSDAMQYGHYWLGLLYFDLPVAVACCFIFHLLVRNPLIDNLPPFIQKRVGNCKYFNWTEYFSKNWLAVIISILIGAALHIAWDQLVHWSSEQLISSKIVQD